MIEVTNSKSKPVRIATTAGVSFTLRPGEIRRLPPFVMTAATQAGCDVRTVEQTVAASEPLGNQRYARLLTTLRRMVGKGYPNDFTTSGRPKALAVRREVGFEVSASELNRAFEEVMGDNGNDTDRSSA